MSWSDPRKDKPWPDPRPDTSCRDPRPHRRAALAVLLGALAAAGGCGFRPVYGPAGSGTALDRATVVAQGPGPNDFTLARALQDRLVAPSDAPRFRLATTLSIREEQVAVTTAQSTNRFNLIGVVDYTLTDITTGATVRAGRIDGFNSYSAIGSSLATRTARLDATDRLMVILADRVMVNLLATAALPVGAAP